MNFNEEHNQPFATSTFFIIHRICRPKFCLSIVFNLAWDGLPWVPEGFLVPLVTIAASPLNFHRKQQEKNLLAPWVGMTVITRRNEKQKLRKILGQIRCIVRDVEVAYTPIMAFSHFVERFRNKATKPERWWHDVKLVLSSFLAKQLLL